MIVVILVILLGFICVVLSRLLSRARVKVGVGKSVFNVNLLKKKKTNKQNKKVKKKKQNNILHQHFSKDKVKNNIFREDCFCFNANGRFWEKKQARI